GVARTARRPSGVTTTRPTFPLLSFSHTTSLIVVISDVAVPVGTSYVRSSSVFRLWRLLAASDQEQQDEPREHEAVEGAHASPTREDRNPSRARKKTFECPPHGGGWGSARLLTAAAAGHEREGARAVKREGELEASRGAV